MAFITSPISLNLPKTHNSPNSKTKPKIVAKETKNNIFENKHFDKQHESSLASNQNERFKERAESHLHVQFPEIHREKSQFQLWLT